MGATMGSEMTAAAAGTIGKVRRDPMAMLPFCGYHMGDYFRHWITMQRSLTNTPRIYHVNWFRRDAQNKFLWPGYGENSRVLKWIVQRLEDKGAARETPIGRLPAKGALDVEGLDIGEAELESLFEVNSALWKQEAGLISSFYERFGERLPAALWREHHRLIRRLRPDVEPGPRYATANAAE